MTSIPTDLALRQQLSDLLRPHLRMLGADAPLPVDADLGKLGLDSLESIDLLMAIERGFGVQIPDELITVESFASLGHLVALVKAAQGC